MNKGTKNFREQVKEITKGELKNARVNIKKYLEGALLSLLGLEKRYSNDYEIDHCNGRNSVLIDAFRDLAISEARKMASAYKPNKEELGLYEKTFKRELNNQFGYVIRDVAKAKALELAEEAKQKIKISVDDLLEEQFGEKPNEKVKF